MKLNPDKAKIRNAAIIAAASPQGEDFWAAVEQQVKAETEPTITPRKMKKIR